VEGTEPSQATKTKAVLIDAESTAVLWMNEAAAQEASETALGLPVAEMMPLVVTLGVPDVLPAVAATGVPQHLKTNLVSTTQGSLAIVASLYRVLDGRLLLLIENAWQPGRTKPSASTSRRSRHQTR